MTASAVNPQNWDEEQKELRRTEVHTGQDASVLKFVSVKMLSVFKRVRCECKQQLPPLALVASLAAAYAAYQAGQAVKASEQNGAQQAVESQLTTAVSAIEENNSSRASSRPDSPAHKHCNAGNAAVEPRHADSTGCVRCVRDLS